MNKILRALGAFYAEFKAQIFTLVGLFMGWILLEGEMKTVIGTVIVIALIIWFTPGGKAKE